MFGWQGMWGFSGGAMVFKKAQLFKTPPIDGRSVHFALPFS
jgi:hypothetical protein